VLAVATRNPQFARLWLAQFVSQTGDWLNRVATLVLIGSVGGSGPVLGVGALFGAELALRLLPSAALGPLAGPVADRLPRRMLMVASDLTRALVVLGFLLVREPGHLPFLYALIVLQMAIGIFFDAARTAALPDTVGKDDLHDAYALSAVTWSITLCFGALAGGWIVQWVGVAGAFVFDAATYLVSAVFLIGVHLPPVPKQEEPFRWRDVFLMTDLKRGLAHARALGIAPILWTKTYWGAAGGYLVLLSLAGRDRFGEIPPTSGPPPTSPRPPARRPSRPERSTSRAASVRASGRSSRTAPSAGATPRCAGRSAPGSPSRRSASRCSASARA
jgi:MFS family permease